MKFRNLQTGQIEELDNAQSKEAFKAPGMYLPVEEKIQIKTVDADGKPEIYEGTPEQARQTLLAAPDDVELFTKVDAAKERFEGGAGGVLAGAAGVASGVLLGLPDIALTKTGLVEPETLEGLREAHPAAHLAGEVAGTVGTAFIPGLNVATGAKLAGAGAKLAAKRVALGALSGAVQQTLSQEAVNAAPFAWSKLGADFARNALVGAAFGGVLSGVGAGASKAARAIGRNVPGVGDTWASRKAAEKWSQISGLEKDVVVEAFTNPKLREKIKETEGGYTSELVNSISRMLKETGESEKKASAEMYTAAEDAITRSLTKSGKPVNIATATAEAIESVVTPDNIDTLGTASSGIFPELAKQVLEANRGKHSDAFVKQFKSIDKQAKEILKTVSYQGSDVTDFGNYKTVVPKGIGKSIASLREKILGLEKFSTGANPVDAQAAASAINQFSDKLTNMGYRAVTDTGELAKIGTSVDGMFPGVINKVLKTDRALYSKPFRARVKNFDDRTKAIFEKWENGKVGFQKMAEDILNIKQEINRDLKRFVKQQQIAGTATPADIDAVNGLVSKFRDKLGNIGGESLLEADAKYAAYKRLQDSLKSLTVKRGDVREVSPGKIKKMLRSDMRYEEFTEAMKHGAPEHALKTVIAVAEARKAHAVGNFLRSQRQRSESGGRQFTTAGLAGAALDNMGLGLSIGALLGLRKNPEVYLAGVDYAQKRLTSETAKKIASASTMAAGYPGDTMAMAAFRNWKEGDNYNKFIQSLEGAAQQTATEVPQTEGFKDQPYLTEVVTTKAMETYDYLLKHAPSQSPSKLDPRKNVRPSDEELRKYAKRVVAALYPDSALERAGVDRETLETIRDLHTHHYQELLAAGFIPFKSQMGAVDIQKLYQEAAPAEPGKPTRANAGLSVPQTSVGRITSGTKK
jgi:hypothetical protein